MAQQIEVDLSKLAKAQSTYDKVATDLSSAIKNLDKSIELLKSSGWKSDASTAYFQLYSKAWKDNMTRRVKILRFIKERLQNAKNEYTAVYNELTSLNLG